MLSVEKNVQQIIAQLEEDNKKRKESCLALDRMYEKLMKSQKTHKKTIKKVELIEEISDPETRKIIYESEKILQSLEKLSEETKLLLKDS